MTLPRKQQHLGDRPTREVYDAQGRSWVLGEVGSRQKDGTCEVALVAEDGDLMRRFPAFPGNWHELSDEALVQLVQSSPRRAQEAAEKMGGKSRGSDQSADQSCSPGKDDPDEHLGAPAET
ncbi:MAG: hypothetical protein M3R65_08185 [Gemmatimonadota bacterium]|nr:hypothetical protein [Gemmatimonadota bacterium]